MVEICAKRELRACPEMATLVAKRHNWLPLPRAGEGWGEGFLPLPTDSTPEKPVVLPVHTGCESRTLPDGKRATKSGFTGYMGRVICSLGLD